MCNIVPFSGVLLTYIIILLQLISLLQVTLGLVESEIRQILTQMMLVDHDHDWKFPNSYNLLPDWVIHGLELFRLQVE